ncbi:MAG TPA: DUF1573 domain-containing protein [Thermoanaerobaculia bacterium]|nr:DUF1573 domain-containing protein [Thermoanaerobaculia bacterium]
MMAEDWNSSGGGRRRPPSRELASLRARYIHHRDTLSKLSSDAPTGHMAQLYERVISEIDSAIQKLDELDKGEGGALALPLATPEAPSKPLHPAMIGAEERIEEREWQAQGADVYSPSVQRDQSGLRKGILALIAIAVIALLAFFAWSVTRTADDSPAVVEEAGSEAEVTPDPTPVVIEQALAISPASFDFGVVAKGTRKAARFQIVNDTGSALPVAVSRSQCRCLWFQHPQIIPPDSTATLSITVDAARAKSGNLEEIVTISSKNDSSITADVEVIASIQ